MRQDLVRLAPEWNNGRLECWNTGFLMQVMKQGVFDFYSIIPVFHYSMKSVKIGISRRKDGL
jgi:hypothetical protein